jgi:tetratricopeptide (TPR) repeat protein
MTALYRIGRQADALATFHATRMALHDALGVEPGPDLQVLQRRILTRDPTLLADPPDPGTPAGPADPAELPAGASFPAVLPLAQLPPDLVDFTGREDHVKHLTDLLAPRPDRAGEERSAAPVALITGLGGIGKTALAVHVAHRIRARYPDGQLYVNLRGGAAQPVAPHQVAGRVLRALGVEDRSVPADEDERHTMFRSALADRRMLIVLDDARDAAQVRPLLPAGGASAALVTSRHRMPGLTGARVQLDVLDATEGAVLFTRIVGADRTSADPAAVADVLAACGYLPLAVRVAASRLAVRRTWAVRSLADRLADTRHRLDELAAEDQQTRATFEVSYQALTDQQARAFRLLAIADLDDISAAAAAALVDLDQRTAEQLAETLADVNLLDPAAPGRYRYHDLLRLFAREQADRAETPAERDAALGRLLAWYHDATRAATHTIRPGYLPRAGSGPSFADPGNARAWLDREHRGIAQTLIQCARADHLDVELLARTLHHLQWYLRASGHWDEWERISGDVLEAAVRAGSAAAELIARGNLGQLAMFRGQQDRAREQLDRALDLARTTGDRSAEAHVLNGLGLLAYHRNRWQVALDHHEQALAILTELGDRHGRCTMLINIGKCHRELHDSGRALDVLEAAGQLARELADQQSETMVLHHVACCHTDLGNLDEAVATHERCLALVRRFGQREGEAYTLAELGQAHLAAHRPAVAVTHLRQAIDMFRALGDANATAVYNADLGHAHRQAGDRDAATTAWTQALHYFQDRDPAMADTIRKALADGPDKPSVALG